MRSSRLICSAPDARAPNPPSWLKSAAAPRRLAGHRRRSTEKRLHGPPRTRRGHQTIPLTPDAVALGARQMPGQRRIWLGEFQEHAADLDVSSIEAPSLDQQAQLGFIVRDLTRGSHLQHGADRCVQLVAPGPIGGSRLSILIACSGGIVRFLVFRLRPLIASDFDHQHR